MVKYIRCDNAGENKKLQEKCEKEGLGVQFEYTAPNTPQRNGRIERKFATLAGRMRAMMKYAGLPEKMSSILWAECARVAILLDNIMPDEMTNKSPYKKFFGKDSPFATTLRTFGEMGETSEDQRKIE